MSATPLVQRSLMSRVLRNPIGAVSAAVVLFVLCVAILAPVLAPNDPTSLQIFKVNQPPDGVYLLGGDSSGRDIFSRLLYGARNTLLGAMLAMCTAALVGTMTGLLAGYFGGRRDALFGWFSDAMQALPAIIILLAFYQALGSSIYIAMAVFGVILSPAFFRLTRSLVRAIRGELFIDATRVAGLSDARIMFRHILPLILAPLVIQMSIVIGIAIIFQAGLEFLGLGDPAVPTWGGMLQDALSSLYVAPIAVWWPGLAISITVAAFVLLANAVRDALQHMRTPRKVVIPVMPSLPEEPVAVPANTILSIRNLAVGYPADEGYRAVVHDVSLNLRRGEVLGLVGESGSGKSQTAFAVLGLLATGGRVLQGSIQLDGLELTKLNAKDRHALRGRRIAYVPQEPMSNLDPSFTVGFQLVEPMRTVLRLSKAQAKAKALELLAKVGIPDPMRVFNAYPHQISGGMAQRVLIAGAISCSPDILIADEPTTALDVTVQAEVLNLLRELQAELEMSIILVTHNFGVVADICDRVAVMRGGEIVETSEVNALFTDPQQTYTRTLLEAAAAVTAGEPRSYNPQCQASEVTA